MSRRTKPCAVAALVLSAVLVAAVLGGADCRNRRRDAFSLEYSESFYGPIIQARTFGGMPAPWDDEAPWFTLYGDGTVVLRGEGGMADPLQRGKMAGADIDALLERIRDTGFFELETFYRDEDVYDYVYSTIEVTVQERSQKVTVYYEKVDAFSATLRVIEEAPVSDLKDYLPERGYLVPQAHTAADKDTVIDESSEIYGLLPDASVLAWAVAEGQPVVIGGKDFALIKRYAADHDAVGLVLKGADGDLILYPVYEPR